MGKIYLIRHGETEANKTFQFQGHIDNPLNSKGLCQAAALGQHYENIVLDEIYSSSMQRARQTAAPLAEAHGLTVQPLDELKEVCFGEWEGLSYDEIKEKWSDQLELFFKQPAQCRMPGGESFDDVALRVRSVCEDLFKNNSDKNIAIASHRRQWREQGLLPHQPLHGPRHAGGGDGRRKPGADPRPAGQRRCGRPPGRGRRCLERQLL